MISFDFEYYKPASVREATHLYKELRSKNKVPHYYGGGTEFISRARRDEIKADAVIDLKGIPDCHVYENDGRHIMIGSAVTLSTITDKQEFPLLSKVCQQIATKTERNKITVGGNLVSHLPYKEAIMPFLLADSHLKVARENQTYKISIADFIRSGAKLQDGEFIIHMITEHHFSQLPFLNVRKTRQSKINYPIVSLATIKKGDHIRIALSGVCNRPFRLNDLESTISDTSRTIDDRIKEVLDILPDPILNDMLASRGYREFVLKNALTEILEKMGGIA